MPIIVTAIIVSSVALTGTAITATAFHFYKQLNDRINTVEEQLHENNDAQLLRDITRQVSDIRNQLQTRGNETAANELRRRIGRIEDLIDEVRLRFAIEESAREELVTLNPYFA